MAALSSSSPSMEDGDSASNTKLCFKIKIPNSTAINSSVHDQSHQAGSGDGEGHIVCEYCGKRFSSGKAWGGHKRHHLQLKKKQKLQQAQAQSPPTRKMKRRRPCRTIYATIKDGKPVCGVCYKDFPSLNSLFAHTRFHHPDRFWRGSQPQSLPAIDLLSDLVGWLKKDKRGRLCMAVAAHNLINLSRCSTESQFICEICNKNFPTGQALGGHKRCHWKPSASPSSGSGNNLAIDLNVPYYEGGDTI